MRLFGWGRTKPSNDRTGAWHTAWATAVGSPTDAAAGDLERALETLRETGNDYELEDEMLDGLRQLITLSRDLAQGRAPAIETAHRVAAGDVCHFSAPVSLPDDPRQPTGRLLLTSTRAVFAGAAAAPLPWHAARTVVHSARDVLLVRAGEEDGLRVRFNSYGEALRAAALATYLSRQARRL